MVKNTKGGKGAKSIARKTTSTDVGRLRLSTCDLEQFACVTKLFGNGMCEIYLNDNTRLMGHIRSKFRGRQKRSNIISSYSIVLVGLREWESTPKNCDILCIYDDNQLEQLSSIPNVNISHILQLKTSNSSSNSNANHDDNLVFTNDVDYDLPMDISSDATDAFVLDSIDDIDIDDI